uniref:Uncharacterized protein n=1 Tax=Brassica oleracea var. oleracea TaxID=109376 RepID=A0A0D3EBR6_BRAOL
MVGVEDVVVDTTMEAVVDMHYKKTAAYRGKNSSGNEFPRKLRGPPVCRKGPRNIPRENFLGIFRWTFRWSNPRKFQRNVPRNFHREFPRNGALGKFRGRSPLVYSDELFRGNVRRKFPRVHFLGI